MKTSLKMLSLLLLITTSSCMFTGVKGNGNVRVEDRSISDNFEEIHISGGLNLDLTHSASNALTVEADENLQELIITEVEDGVLKIYTVENIWRASAKTIHLATDNLVRMKATSGSVVKNRDALQTPNFELSSTSGSNVSLILQVDNFECSATSGTNIVLEGLVKTAELRATSGSVIMAKELQTASANVSVTSGANITVGVEKELIANASSGGNVWYYGKPESLKKNTSSGGHVSER